MKTTLPCGHEVDMDDMVDMLNHIAIHAPPADWDVKVIESAYHVKYDRNTNTFNTNTNSNERK